MTDRSGLQLQLVPDRTPEAGRGPDATPGVALSRLLTAQEVAEAFRVPRSTIYELARNRRIPYLKVGRRTLFEPNALAAWIASHMVDPRS